MVLATPMVTIGIPVMNRLRYQKEAIRSALAQTYSSIEVLISQDPTESGIDPEIADWSQALAARDSRVRYRHNSQKRGAAGNWNSIADDARGTYLMIIGDDDRLEPICVETLLREITRFAAEIAFSNHWLIDSEGRRLVEASQEHAHRHRGSVPPGILQDPATWVWSNAIPLTSSLMKTSWVRQFRFREDLNTPETELNARMVAAGGQYVFVPDYLAEYRSHNNSLTGQGLQVERMIKYLAPIEVPLAVEPIKRRYLAGVLVASVSRALASGNVDDAKSYLRDPYYPGWKSCYAISTGRLCKSFAQRLLVHLPGATTQTVFRLWKRFRP